MPQKPQVRAKDKARLTKRLAAWRAKQAAQQDAAAQPPKTATSSKAG